MAHVLTERIVILVSPEQKARVQAKAIELGSSGAVVRRGLDLLFASDVSQSKQTSQKSEAKREPEVC